MGCDRMGFGTDDDRFSATRAAPRDDNGPDSDDDNERHALNRRRHISDDTDDFDMDEEKRSGGDDDGDGGDQQQRQHSSAYAGQGMMRVGNQRVAALRAEAASRDRDPYLSDDTDIEEEMMRIDPVDLEWRRQLHAGDPVDAQNIFGNWCPATILRIADGEVHVRYLNMNDAWLKWLPMDSGQLAPPATRTRNDSAPLRLAQVVEVRKPGTSFWKEAHVVKARPHDLLVRYAGRQQQYDEWMPFTPETVSAAGDHVRVRNLAEQRRLRVKPNADRHRVIQAQNPRFQHYHSALAAHGLRIHAVEGDGNCLFRSVSHQVYGDDAFHGLVRRHCMEYMESEKEYFEPYVVGDMSAFLRYLQHKRRDGVWGDDPEIQAMCELYDRPAEVYAYDPTRGFRKLRTFHEHSALARNRPPICLSYYGGGHYDSIVGPLHAANVVREEPGEWEQRHLEISRRINTREGHTEPTVMGGSISGQRVTTSSGTPTSTTGDTTEMEELEQILMASRHEFDAMRSNLDDTLKRTLADSEATAVDSEQRALALATQESEMAAIQADLLVKAQQASEEELLTKALNESLQERHGGSHDDHAAHSSMDFDAQVSAAIQASMMDHTTNTSTTTTTAADFAFANDEDDQMRRILEMSAKEYEAAAAASSVSLPPPLGTAAFDFGFGFSGASGDGRDDVVESDEMDELQRAIQASLQDS